MIGKIFYYDEDYVNNAKWCNENDCHIEEIESDEAGRRFIIKENEKESIEVVLRQRREEECFPVVNRGQLWYDKLSQEQKEELKKWYQDWLDCTKTKIAPTTPIWIKV